MRKAVISLFVFFAFHQAQAACPWAQPSDLLVGPVDPASMNIGSLSVAEVQEDLDCLKLHYETQYIAEYLARGKNIRLTDSITRLRDSIQGPLTQEQLMDAILKVSSPAHDTHFALAVFVGGQPVQKRHAFYSIFYVNKSFRKEAGGYRPEGASYSIVSCERFDVFPVLDAEGRAGAYTFVGQFNDRVPTDVRCLSSEGQPVSLPVVKLELNQLDESAGKFHFELLEGSVLYVRIPAFTPDISSEQQKLIDFLKDESRSYPILFDLRQNGGGDNTFAHALAEVLRSKSEKGPDLEIIDKVSLGAIASSVNMSLLQWQGALQNHDPEAQSYEAQVKEYTDLFKARAAENPSIESVSIKKESIPGKPGARNSEYSGRIVLLFDKFCASACESMMGAFAGIRNVVRIGSNSAGAFHFGNVGFQVLPHSKIAIQSGWRGIEYSVPVQEGLGFAPDYYFLGSDALGAAKAFLKNADH